jgi:hypothetical protein
LVAESVNLRLAVRLPAPVGLNAIAAEQVPDAARLVPQVLLEIRKSAALVPEIATLLMVMEDVSLFDNVPDWDALVEPTKVLAKVRLEGLAETLPPAAVPCPVNATFCGVLLAESLKFNVALRAPVAVGPKMIFAVQFADAAREVPQVLLKIKKSPGFAPVKVMLPMVIAAAPLFVRVTTFWAPLPPTGTDTQFRAAGETDTCAMAVAPCTKQIPNATFTRRARDGS